MTSWRKMNLVKEILLLALVGLFCIQLASSTSCFCTNKGEVSLYENKELTIVATTVSKSKTCFIGTKMNEEDNPIDKRYIQIEELSFGRCGDDQQSVHFGNLFMNGHSFASLSSSYIGTYDDFFEIPLQDVNKRFLAEVNGEWGMWTPWSTCRGTCTRALQQRVRDCANPAPSFGGLFCIGKPIETQSCTPSTCQSLTTLPAATPIPTTTLIPTTNPIPKTTPIPTTLPTPTAIPKINGEWGLWTHWSTCRGTCTRAVQQRVRNCDNPPPSFGGLFCIGEPIETQSCTPSTCQPLTTIPATTPIPTKTPIPTTPPPTTAAPTRFQCYACDGPLPELCISMTKVVTCPEPYCINELTNNNNGEKIMDRRCGTKHECDIDWWVFTSDNKKCTLYDDPYIVAFNIHCTFCCTDELCNRPTIPSRDSLYRPHS